MARRTDGGEEWLASLPGLVDALAERWALTVGPSFAPGGLNSWVAPVRRADGEAAVLKVTVPHAEAACEVDALVAWNGRGAVRVLEHHRPSWACVLERCVPGDALRDVWLPDEDAADVLARVLVDLWSAPVTADVPDIGEEMARQAAALRELSGQYPVLVDARCVERALEVFDRGHDGSERVLLHRDLHAGNILRSERGWLAIDPKPSVGPPWCDLGQALANGVPSSRQVDRLAGGLGLDRHLVAEYALATCVLMSFWNNSLGRPQIAHELAARAVALASA